MFLSSLLFLHFTTCIPFSILMLVMAQNYIVLKKKHTFNDTQFTNLAYSSPVLMTLYIRRSRLHEERIGYGMPIGFSPA